MGTETTQHICKNTANSVVSTKILINSVVAMFCKSFFNNIDCGSGTVGASSTWKQDISNQPIWKLLGNV